VFRLLKAQGLVWILTLASCSDSPVAPGPPEQSSSSNTATLASCGSPAPTVLAPSNGATVRGSVVVSAELLEGPCFIAASTVMTITSGSGAVIASLCDNGIPASRTWDTTQVKDGPYLVTAQRACSCNLACAEVSDPVRLFVSNGT
jgi:hypothetical protein